MGPGGDKVAKQSFAGKERSQAGAWEREDKNLWQKIFLFTIWLLTRYNFFLSDSKNQLEPPLFGIRNASLLHFEGLRIL